MSSGNLFRLSGLGILILGSLPPMTVLRTPIQGTGKAMVVAVRYWSKLTLEYSYVAGVEVCATTRSLEFLPTSSCAVPVMKTCLHHLTRTCDYPVMRAPARLTPFILRMTLSTPSQALRMPGSKTSTDMHSHSSQTVHC